jgi:hypothetical protein
LRARHLAIWATSRLADSIGLLRSPPQTHHVLQNVADIAENADIGVDILVDRRRVDVDVDLLRVGENASSRPVMRSSKRAPMQIMTSQSCIAMLAS